ncbi:MAG: HYR domain-containing protein, partial [Chitinophagales bacterium]
DTLAPTAQCQAYTAYLDASGNASIDTNNINNGSTDNCAIDTMYLSQYDFTCADAGSNNVWLYVKDVAGNIDSCQAVVTVQDTVAPTAQCQAYTAYLDASGNASIDTNNINNGSTDNCAIDTMYLSQYNFTCANVGANTVTLTVEDVNGNSSTCTATVTIQDTVAPTAQCQPFTTQLSTSGLAVVTPQDIDNGSYDNCGIDTMYLSQDSFTCADYGLNNITLYVIDNYGNIDSCATYIDIQDNTAPIAVCHDTTLYLDATGTISITAADVDGGSWDSCGINSISIDKTNFTCADLGANTVTLSVSDNKGNTGTCTATVTVLDTLAPTVMCQNVTVQLDVFGQASITTSNIDNGTTDNCGTPTLSLSQTTFDCTNLGANTVILTATDASGNTDSCTATVTVEDNLMPTVVCKNISVQLSTAGTASIVPADVINSMSDNCGIDTAFIDIYNFTCTNIGANDVLVTVRDSAGNTATCTATVTVQGDSTTPQVTCNTTTVYLDAAGQASVTNADLTASATAVCGIADTTLSQYNFSCADIGTNNVTVTLTDQNGKAGMCTAQVTVLDTFTTVVLPYSNACAGSTVSITAQAGRAGAL